MFKNIAKKLWWWNEVNSYVSHNGASEKIFVPSKLIQQIHETLIEENRTWMLFGSALHSYYHGDYPVHDVDILTLDKGRSPTLDMIDGVDQFFLASRIQPYYLSHKPLLIWLNQHTYTLFKIQETKELMKNSWLITPPQWFIPYFFGMVNSTLSLATKDNREYHGKLVEIYQELQLKKAALENAWLMDAIQPLDDHEFLDIFSWFDLHELRNKYSNQLKDLLL